MKKNILVIFFSIVFSVFILETLLSYNDKIISDYVVLRFPDTKLKKKILFERNFPVVFKNNIIEKKFGSTNYKLIQNTITSPVSKQDLKYGAKNKFFYNKGFCNIEYDFTNPVVISVGDSYTFCTAVNPSVAWPKKIFKSLPKKNSLNLGMTGQGPHDYNEILSEMINENTQLVIFAIYEGNDFRNMRRFMKEKQINKKIIVENSEIKKSEFIKIPIIETSIKKIFGNLYLTNMIWSFRTIIFKPGLNKKYSELDFRYKRISTNELLNTNNSDAGEVVDARKLNRDPNRYNENLNNLDFAFAKAKKIAKKNNSEIIFVYIPTQHTSLKGDLEFNDKSLEKLLNDFSNMGQEIFNKVCKVHDLFCINLTNSFVEKNKENKLPSHFPTNNHLTAKGHDIVAKEILEFVCRNNLIINSILYENCIKEF